MTEQLGVLLFTTGANLLLGYFVWRRSPGKRVNQYFALFSASIAIWALSNGLVNAYASSPSGIIWARIAFASASASVVSFLFFVGVFPAPQRPPSIILDNVFRAAGVTAIVLSFTPLITQQTAAHNGVLRVTYGPLHAAFAAYFISASAYNLYLLVRKHNALTGIPRIQVRHVFFGVLLTGIGGMITNLLIPLLFGSSRFSPYGPLFTLMTVASIAHSIIRYRFLNVRLVLRRGATYGLAVSSIVALFIMLVWVSSLILDTKPAEVPLWVSVAFVTMAVVAFQPLKAWVQLSLDSYFFRNTYDYQRTIRELSRTMTTLLDLQSLLKYAGEAILTVVKSEHVVVYGEDITRSSYRLLFARGALEIQGRVHAAAFERNSPIATLLASERRHVSADDLSRGVPDVSPLALNQLRAVGAELALPILEDSKLTGFFLVGRKLSTDPYFADDIDLLNTVVSQASIAIKNSRLYRHVLLVNEHIENILSTMDSGVIAIDADGLVTLFNPAVERITGLAATQVKKELIDNLPATIAHLLRDTLSDNQPRPQVETAIRNSSGRVIPIICSTSTLKDGTEATVGAVAVLSDLTRLKQLEGEKRRAERLASIGALASGIGHEIKNPLVAIKTFAELLPERFAEEDFRSDFSKVVTQEIERIDDLIDRLRGFATSTVRPFAPTDIRSPIEDTLALLRGQLEQGRISVKTSYGSDIPLVAGDAAQLKQLFLNLFQNALEAMQPEGELSIRLSTHESLEHQILAIEISDTGTGVPERLLAKLFDPFVTSKQSGTGLGLSICRGIADAHGATIRVQNNANSVGATVIIDFPLLRETTATTTSAID